MRCLPLLVCLGASFAVAGAISEGSEKKEAKAASFLANLAFKQVLRVCNAYPDQSAMDIYIGNNKLNAEPLNYKECDEYTEPLSAGDKVDFKVEKETAGTFTISELPNSDATLMMVISKHDTISSAVAFESHVFAKTQSAQIAVIDTYRGKNPNTELRIRDAEKPKDHSTRSEMLRFDSVVAVNEGAYQVELDDPHGKKRESLSYDVVALKNKNYCVIRVGVNSEEGQKYPPELMLYPHSDKKDLPQRSGAASYGFAGMLVAVFAAAMA